MYESMEDSYEQASTDHQKMRWNINELEKHLSREQIYEACRVVDERWMKSLGVPAETSVYMPGSQKRNNTRLFGNAKTCSRVSY